MTAKEAPLASTDESAAAAVTELAHSGATDCAVATTPGATGKPVATSESTTCADEPTTFVLGDEDEATVAGVDSSAVSCSILMSDLSKSIS